MNEPSSEPSSESASAPSSGSASAASVTIDEQAAIDRYLDLTAIPGKSREEGTVADRIQSRLRELDMPGLSWQLDHAGDQTDPTGEVGNLIVSIDGDESKPRTMLSAHMDTVPICVGCDPVVQGDEVVSRDPNTGLGADDRSGCAAILSAIVERSRRDDAATLPPAVVTFLVQEEIGLRGARHLDASKVGRVDRAFNFDGGAPEKITIGAIGGQRMSIRVHGVPSHAGVAPENGVSAIVIASRAIADLATRGWLGLVIQGDQKGTANVGVFHGGEATNVITPEVHLRAEARSHDGEFREQIVQTIRNAFESAAAAETNRGGTCGTIEFESQVDYEAFRLADDHPSIAAASEAIRMVGREPRTEVGNGGLDANWLFNHGIEAVTLGCGQKNIHTADERLVIAEYLDACRIATSLIV